MSIYKKLAELNLTLPEAGAPGGLYSTVRQTGNLLYTSGHTPTKPLYQGKVGADCSLEQAQAAAQDSILRLLASLHAYTGDLNKIKGVVKILCFVASAPGFTDQPKVANAASQLLIDLWGEAGARSAVGAAELPSNFPVEIEVIFELDLEDVSKFPLKTI